MADRWALFIDIEGFSAVYKANEANALHAWRQLSAAVYAALKDHPPAFPRMGAHQVGDGFIVVAWSGDEPLEQPLVLAIALMQNLLRQGITMKASVSVGNFSDIGGCLPPEIRSELSDGHSVHVGDGLMTFQPVMGTAFINAHRLTRRGGSGPRLLIDRKLLPVSSFVVSEYVNGIAVVDWLRSSPPLLVELTSALRWPQLPPAELAGQLRQYLDRAQGLSDAWQATAEKLIDGT